MGFPIGDWGFLGGFFGLFSFFLRIFVLCGFHIGGIND